jgi:hypothetical protein
MSAVRWAASPESRKTDDIVDSQGLKRWKTGMGEPQLPREVRRRLTILQHAEEVTGSVATSRDDPG